MRHVVFINSNTAYRAIPDRIAYETSKGAQLGMMRGLALDLGKYGIRVNAVLPGKDYVFQDDKPNRTGVSFQIVSGETIAESRSKLIKK